MSEEQEEIMEQEEFEIMEDEGFLIKEDYNWEDLTDLKNEIGLKLGEFMVQVDDILNNKELLSNLGDKTKDFTLTISLFLKDINNFSLKIQENRLKHEGKSGRIVDLEEFDEYNRLAMIYHGLFSELIEIITPSMTSIMLIVAEVIDESRYKAMGETKGEEEVKKDE